MTPGKILPNTLFKNDFILGVLGVETVLYVEVEAKRKWLLRSLSF
jgi:hypothetical protein